MPRRRPFAIRDADAADAPAVADVLIATREAAAGLIPPAVHGPAEIRQWVADVLLPGTGVVVAVDADGACVGFAALAPGWLEQLWVLPDWQGRGVGGALVDLAKTRSPGGLQLWVFASNAPAIAFYRRRGFAIAESRDGSGNEEGEPDHRMLWPGKA